MVMALRPGHTIDWVASELDIPVRRLRDWMAKGLLPSPGKGSRSGYTYEFLDRALVIHEWLQLYPRGPIDNLRDLLDPEDEEVVS